MNAKYFVRDRKKLLEERVVKRFEMEKMIKKIRDFRRKIGYQKAKYDLSQIDRELNKQDASLINIRKTKLKIK